VTSSGARQPADLPANASAAAAAVLFGASVIAVRVAVREIPPVSLAVLRFGQGGLLLAGILLVVAPRYLRTSWERLRLFGLPGIVLFVLFPLTFNVGLRYTEASRGAVMLATMPIWSAVLGSVAGERLSRRQAVGVGPRWWASAWPSRNPGRRSAATPCASSVTGSCSSPGCSARCTA
jgi:drug/metabolite transporter (DMT)-like permease